MQSDRTTLKIIAPSPQAPAWDDSMALGHPVIDAQHRWLVETVSALHLAVAAGDESCLPGCLIEFKNYAAAHFAEEERIMQDRDHPERDRHLNEHAIFLHTLQEIQDQLARKEPLCMISTVAFLTDWLLNHVKGTDRTLAAILTGPDTPG